MAAVTVASASTRDYKASRRPGLDARRVRDFSVGAAAGVALTVVAFLWAGAAARRAAADQRSAHSPQQHLPAVAPPAGAAATPTVDEILTRPDEQLPRQIREMDRAAAARHQ